MGDHEEYYLRFYGTEFWGGWLRERPSLHICSKQIHLDQKFPKGKLTVAMDLHCLAVRQIAFAGLTCALTPELSRTAARNGGVVHVTMQPSREAVSA